MDRDKVKKIFWYFLFGGGGLLILLAALLLINTLLFSSRQIKVAPVTDFPIDKDRVVKNLARAIQFKTISYQDPEKVNFEEFRSFHRWLAKTFPTVHKSLKKELVGDYSLLYKWEGKDKSKNSFLLMAHQDVVPIEEGTEEEWKEPPFAGHIKGGFIWGRGTMDDKGMMLATLEAVEALLKEGFQPQRTLYLAYGHDEEVGGLSGAAKIAETLKERGVELDFVIDEGLVIVKDILPGIEVPVALLGISEKGRLTLELSVKGEGGHSSMPPKETAVGILSTAMHRVEKNPLPARIKGPTRKMFEYLGPEMPFTKRLALGNLWLFEPLVISKFAAKPTTNTVVRTTTALTMIKGGFKENVVPTQATGYINFRILPGDSVKSVKDHVKTVIDDPRVKIEIYGKNYKDPTSPASLEAPSFAMVHRTIKEIFPKVIFAPGIVVGQTDSRHFEKVCSSVYRFSPLVVGPQDRTRIHGTNERVSVENYAQCVHFFYQLIKNANGADSQKK